MEEISNAKSIIRILDYNKITINNLRDIENLRMVSNKEISSVCGEQNSKIIVFPSYLGQYYDGIEEKKIIELSEKPNGEAEIKALDILGFIGVDNTFLQIGTRFTGETDIEDFFLQYLLQKVLKINIFKFTHPSKQDGVLDLLVYLFPGMLTRALRQGLLKRYTLFEKNDSNIKGPIDVSRHIRSNPIFNGNIAYNYREHSYDNSTIQLIRHTIEFIRVTKNKNILTTDAVTREGIKVIESATPSYNKNNRVKIILENKKRKPHPYYTEYDPLIQLCISILEHRHIRYHQEKKIIYGILFSGSWLWEEYLNNVIFHPLGFIHPDNRKKTNAVYVFNRKHNLVDQEEDFLEKEYGPRFPDYMFNKVNIDTGKDETLLIVDAKYRHHSYCGDRDNLNQLISYLYITQAKRGALIYPISTETDKDFVQKLKDEYKNPKGFNGYGGFYHRIGFEIPTKMNSYKEFVAEMIKEEKRIIEEIDNIIKKDFNSLY